MANRIFHIKVRQFPIWFRAAIAVAVLIAFYGFIWSLVRPTHASLFDVNRSTRSSESAVSIEGQVEAADHPHH